MDTNKTDFKDAVKELEKYGITGKYVYLLDIIPLIEIAWADGRIQEIETKLMQEFIKQHISKINILAGTEVITYKEASNFLTGFLIKRPDPEILKILRRLVIPARLNGNDPDEKENQTITILKFCMDIAANAVTHYPYTPHERFSLSEKDTFIEILKTFNIKQDREISIKI